MTQHIHGRRALFEDDISQERIVFAVCRVHIDEYNFTMNGAESFDLNLYRPTNHAGHFLLRGRFKLGLSDFP